MTQVHGNMTITQGATSFHRNFRTSSGWYKNSDYYTITQEDDMFIITKHYLDVPANALKNKGMNIQTFSQIPFGNYEFGEDSTEDELVIYLK